MDGSPQSADALKYALREFADDDITVLHVINPIEAGYGGTVTTPGSSEEWYEAESEAAEGLFESAQELADEYGVTLTTAVETGPPARTVVEYAEENDVDQVVVGSHGRTGVSRLLLGSVAETIVRRSPVPVTIVR